MGDSSKVTERAPIMDGSLATNNLTAQAGMPSATTMESPNGVGSTMTFRTTTPSSICGFRMRPTAGTASGVHPVPLGFGRVYVHQPKGFAYDTWVQGLDRGNSFVTTGPMLFVKMDGKDAGTTFKAEAGREFRIEGSAVAA